MPIKFRCPKCRQAYSIASKKAGTSLRCQKCDAKMRIPAPKPAADELADSSRPTQKPTEAAPPIESSLPTDDQPDLAAMRNLLDDDDDIGNDDLVDLSADDLPTHAAALASATKDEPARDGKPGVAGSKANKAAVNESSPESMADSKPADDDDLAAVLAFEDAIEGEEGLSPAASAPLPDELFAEDDDEEDEGWGRGRGGEDEEMDLTPMVDVTFLLLVFFMITASFSIQKTLEVPPPNPDEQGASQSTKIEDIKEQSVEVHIDSRNVISVDDVPLSDPSRLADIMRSSRMSEVLITAHENSLHDMLVKVIDAANEIGMQKIRVGITKGID